MKCFKCKGEMRHGSPHIPHPGDSTVVVRHVPCLQCDTCGEIAYSGEVTENLEKIVKNAKQALTEVAVVKYPDAVA